MQLRARLLAFALTGVFSVASFTSATLVPSVAQAADAIGAFKAKHDAVVKLVKKKADDAALETEVDKVLDYDWLAEQALGGPDNYGTVCANRCDEFKALLTKLVRANYLKMVRKAQDHAVEYVGQVEGRNGAYKVTTKIQVVSNGRDKTVTVEYVMHQQDGDWQVRDIITDDISLAKNYRYEFNKIVKAEGIDGLIRKLEDKLAKIDD